MLKTRTTRPSPPRRPPALTVSRQDAVARLKARIERATQVRAGLQASDRATAEKEYEAWHRYNLEMLVRMFANSSVAEGYDSCEPPPVIFLEGSTARLARGESGADRSGALHDKDLLGRLDAKVNRLRQVWEQLELHDESASPAAAAPSSSAPTQRSEARRAAFLVHGHDEEAREAAVRVLQQLDIEPIILHERPDEGRTILEMIEASADVAFAVVLLTPYDVGRTEHAELRSRARHDVVLAMGFFCGKLGRSRVCVLYKEDIGLPSDVGGLVFVKMDDTGAWRFQLADELDAAGLEIDFNRLRRR